jgi:hypothetical protein
MVIYDRKISAKIDGQRLEALQVYARKEGVTVSTLLRHLVCRFLESQQRFAPSLENEVKDGF